MRDIPIIFSGPMVRALLAGSKTMTRRLAWRPSKRAIGVLTDPKDREAKPTPWQSVKAGDRLWVRENFVNLVTGPIYVADGPIGGARITPCIHMPRWASRLTLIVGAVKIERLQEISLQDVRAEGCEVRHFWLFGADGPERQKIGARVFGCLWEELHGPGSWDANPWVVALPFAVHQKNIDALRAAA